MDPYLLLVYIASAFAVAFLFFPVLIKMLSGWKVFDAPGKHKIHLHYVPAMGGICILLGAGFSLLIGLPFSVWLTYKFLLVSIALMFVIGLRDDILTLSPGEKLMGQLLPIIILVVFGDTLLSSFYGTFLQTVFFPMPVAWLVTVFVVVTLTNAYNLIDGIDGLAGTIAVLALSSFGLWFYVTGDANTALIALSFVGAALAFLFFNWEPSKIFMGDTGALVVGLLLSFLSIKFINVNFGLPDSNPFKFQSSIGTAMCVLIVPIFDTVRVIIVRLSRVQSPFKADHNHLHHQLLNLGYTHSASVFIMGGINLMFIGIAIILRNHGDAVLLPIALLACVLITMTIRIARKKNDIHAGKSSIATK